MKRQTAPIGRDGGSGCPLQQPTAVGLVPSSSQIGVSLLATHYTTHPETLPLSLLAAVMAFVPGFTGPGSSTAPPLGAVPERSSALHRAVVEHTDAAELAAAVAAAVASGASVRGKDSFGQCALHVAVLLNPSPEAVVAAIQALLAAGADVNARDSPPTAPACGGPQRRAGSSDGGDSDAAGCGGTVRRSRLCIWLPR